MTMDHQGPKEAPRRHGEPVAQVSPHGPKDHQRDYGYSEANARTSSTAGRLLRSDQALLVSSSAARSPSASVSASSLAQKCM